MSEETLKNTLGEALKKKLLELVADGNRTQIAKDIQISRTTLYRCEQGEVPSLPNLLKLANYFDVDIDFLLGRSPKRKSLNTPYITKDSELKAHICDFLRSRRRKIAKEAFAETHGFSRSTWASYESEVSLPRVEHLIYLADCLDVSSDDLLKREVSK